MTQPESDYSSDSGECIAPLGVWMLIGLGVFLVVWPIWAHVITERRFSRENPHYVGQRRTP